MSCFNPEPIYANPPFRGIQFVGSKGDGYGIQFRWYKALSPNQNFRVAYNFYYSTIKNDVFDEGVKYVVINPDQVTGELTGFIPGDIYYFAVRGTLYSTDINNLSLLPEAPNGCKIYPQVPLTSDISATDTVIPIMDADLFPPFGVIQIGAEIIYYTSVDIPGNSLITSLNHRGMYDSEPRLHTTDGYDGVRYYDNPFVRYFIGFEDGNTAIILEENKFDYPNYPRTNADGYRQKVDNVTTNLTSTEIDNIDFPSYDYTGWHRNDPVDLLAGKCLGTYIGGEYYCADGYLGVGRRIRGLPIQDHNNQREEILLNTTGEPVVLFRKVWNGITSNQYTSSKESPEYRALDSFGVDTVVGYEQFFNPRRSDGRIMVKIDPTMEDLLSQDDGLEPIFVPNCWTLVVPIVKDRDFFIRFNEDGTEEFRYMILNVTRNKIFLDNYGRQVFAAKRMPKTDPIYQVPYLSDSSTMPRIIRTTMASVPGILPHYHTITVNEGIVSVAQINQLTSVNRGHSHPIYGGQIISELSHSHQIILI